MITPELSKTSLLPSDSVRIAALAVGMQGEYGAVTDIAQEYSVSRPTVYDKGVRGRQALLDLFEPRGNGKVLARVDVDEAQLKRAIVSAYVEGPNSVRDVQALVEAFYGVYVGYGKVFAIIEEAQGRAAEFNRSVRLDAVKAAAPDELFSQGAPVFPNAQQRDDTFHARWKKGQVAQRLEKYALAALQELLDTEEQYLKASCRAGPMHAAGQNLRRARERFEEAADRHRRFELPAEELSDAMEFVDLETGIVRKGADQQAAIPGVAERMAALGGRKIKALARYIKNSASGLALYIDELRQRLNSLAEDIGGDVVATCTLLWRCLHEHGRCPE